MNPSVRVQRCELKNGLCIELRRAEPQDLVERALDLARARGIDDVYLLTNTAENYFPKFGFVCVGRDSVAPEVRSSVEFQTACPASAVAMRKRLRV